jgi:hypothetical protein
LKQLLDAGGCSAKQVPEKQPANIFLTGATGFLGARLLYELLAAYKCSDSIVSFGLILKILD